MDGDAGRATETNRELSTEEADQINRSIKRAKKIEVRRQQANTMMEEDERYEGQQATHGLGADINARGINYREVLMGCDNQDGEVKTPMATMEDTIGYGIGRTLRIDRQTAASSRGNFARLCVELDLSQALKPKINVAEMCKVGSEEKLGGGEGGTDAQGRGGKPMKNAVCVEKARSLVPPTNDLEIRNQASKNNLPAFGPWMIVNGKSNRFRNSAKIKGSATTKSGEPKALSSRRGSRFGILEVEDIAASGKESKEVGITHANLVNADKSNWNQASRVPQDGPQDVGRKEKDERSVPRARLVGHGKDQVSENITGNNKAGSPVPAQSHAMNVEWIENVANEKVTEMDEMRRLGNVQGKEQAPRSQSVPYFQAGETYENPIPITDWDSGSSLQQTRTNLLGTTGREVVTTIPMAAPMEFVPETQYGAISLTAEDVQMAQYIREHRPDIVIILEPRISEVEADRVHRYFREFFSQRIEAQGFSGGIWVWWKHNVITLSSFSSFGQAMLFKVALETGKEIWLTAVYGSPVEMIRRDLWVSLRNIANGMVGCWAVVGDFNEIAAVEEKEETRKTSYGRPFRYQAIWQRHPKFVEFLKTTWPQHVGIDVGLHIMQKELIKWNHEVFGLVQVRKRKLLNRLAVVRGLISDHEALWSQVLIHKYEMVDAVRLKFKATHQASWLWHAICDVWKKVVGGIGWSIGSGQQVQFWTDLWTASASPLIELETEEVPEEARTRCVDYYADRDRGWIWEYFQHSLPMSSLLQIAAIPTPSNDRGADLPICRLTSNGNFSIKSAYGLLTKDFTKEEKDIWKVVWKWKGPQRVKTFLWLLSHGKLLTNEARLRRNLAPSASCPICQDHTESMLHAIRDCPKVREMWKSLVPRKVWEQFFSNPIDRWLLRNIRGNQQGVEGVEWRMLFVVGCWLMWKWRNYEVFDGNFTRPPNDAMVVYKVAASFHMSILAGESNDFNPNGRVWRNISWLLPSNGWMALNTDGASKGNPGVVGAGGVIRDTKGRWLHGFVQNIGIATSFVAELWAIKVGLLMAWEKGYRRVRLQGPTYPD
ncbi:hypothetical protein K2173_008147 [Erythroxylum novogranatense]|uniref:RNase H type-1 domain-containing protein n=1 Tax=Erythroxylum novogranatense TaxID=1862640 RepID=A0AAV8UCK0_9ROSI|nr:hypothetical protein K2173_008147 [Erythroxylum novogranatense]